MPLRPPRGVKDEPLIPFGGPMAVVPTGGLQGILRPAISRALRSMPTKVRKLIGGLPDIKVAIKKTKLGGQAEYLGPERRINIDPSQLHKGTVTKGVRHELQHTLQDALGELTGSPGQFTQRLETGMPEAASRLKWGYGRQTGQELEALASEGVTGHSRLIGKEATSQFVEAMRLKAKGLTPSARKQLIADFKRLQEWGR